MTDPRDEMRADVEHGKDELRAERDRLRAALTGLMEAADRLINNNKHFYDCLPGRRGSEPDDESCSRACVELRHALAAAEKAVKP